MTVGEAELFVPERRKQEIKKCNKLETSTKNLVLSSHRISRRIRLGARGFFFRGEAAIVRDRDFARQDLDRGFAAHNRSFAMKKKAFSHPGYEQNSREAQNNEAAICEIFVV